MKRLIILTISLCLIFSTVAFAADIDLTTLSDDELTELKLKVEQEYLARSLGESAVLQEGEYIVGKDIKAGSYVFTALVASDYDNNVFPCTIYYYPNEDDYNNYKNQYSELVDEGNPVRINFEDGNIVLITEQSVGATYTDPLPFAP